MIPQLGAPIGFILASALFAFFKLNLNEQDFLDWGWRYPFFVAFAINVVALFARLRLVATPEFGALLERHELEAVRISELLRLHGRDVIIGAFAPLASFALFHLVTVFPLGWLTLYTDQSPVAFMMVQIIGALCCIAAIIAPACSPTVSAGAGSLPSCRDPDRDLQLHRASAARRGSRGSLFLRDHRLLAARPFLRAGGGGLASRFGSAYRYTGAAMTSDLSWLIGAGFAPLVALSALQPVRAAICRLLSAVGRDLHDPRPGLQPQVRNARHLRGSCHR